MAKPVKPILCLDFDGVIHSYSSGWKGARNIPDPPVEGAGLFLLQAVQHFKTAIFSSRTHQWGGRRAMRAYVRELLWTACLHETDEMERAWTATQGTPADYIPWTAYDVRDVADHIHRAIRYPLFKPPATVTIDDRALTFDGTWPAIDALQSFKPWNKRPRSQGLCETTLTERFDLPSCSCGTYSGNLGPCKNWEPGMDPARCVYCDHVDECHRAVGGVA